MIDKNTPAYPLNIPEDKKKGWPQEVYKGISIRQYYAAKAMQGLITLLNEDTTEDIKDISQLSFQIADSMIDYENKENK